MPDASPHGSQDSLRASVGRIVSGSRVVALAVRIRDANADSRVNDTVNRLGTFTRRSFLYRWLTTEPEPEVVVIDLQDTYTVGPFIRLLDGILARAAPWWRESRVAQLLQRVETLLGWCVDTRGRTIQRFLEPPNPPENDERDDGEP